jgi:hypothetical protein
LPLISFEAHVKSNMGPQQATEFTWGECQDLMIQVT